MNLKNLILKIHKQSENEVADFIENNYNVEVGEVISIALHVDENTEKYEELFVKFINSQNQLRFVRVKFDGKNLIPIDKSEVLPASKAMEKFCEILGEPYQGAISRATYWKMMVIWGSPN